MNEQEEVIAAIMGFTLGTVLAIPFILYFL